MRIRNRNEGKKTPFVLWVVLVALCLLIVTGLAAGAAPTSFEGPMCNPDSPRNLFAKQVFGVVACAP